jgi:4'-phosphopantetheinyl transferase
MVNGGKHVFDDGRYAGLLASGIHSFRHSSAVKLALSTSDIHIWCASLDQPSVRMYRLERTLAADEHERAARLHFERDRRRFVAARGLLRTLLGAYMGIPPHDIRFEYGPHGKPMLQQAPGAAAIQFNVSHSHGLALYAITRDREIGVDVEYVRPLPDADQIAERFFSSTEHSAFCAVSTNQKLETFYKCWTRKEAFIKAGGRGLAQPLDGFEVSINPEEPARLVSIDGDKHRAAEWAIMELFPAQGYVAALAIKSTGLKVTCMDFEEFVQLRLDNDN